MTKEEWIGVTPMSASNAMGAKRTLPAAFTSTMLAVLALLFVASP